MKNFLKYFLAVLILGTFFTGCKKDKTKPNYFSVDGTKYSISWGDMYRYGTGAEWEGYRIQVWLYENTITLDPITYMWGGSGSFIGFELASLTSNAIETGTYTFHYRDILPVFCFDENSYWEINWNSSPNYGEYLNSGQLIVNNLGDDKYEFTFTGTDFSGDDIKTHFKGTISYNWDMTTKSSDLVTKPSPGGMFIME